MPWLWVVMLVGLTGGAWAQRGPQSPPSLRPELLGPNSFDARSFDGLAGRAGPHPADGRPQERLPLPGGFAGGRAGQNTLSDKFAAPPSWRNPQNFGASAPSWNSPLPSFATQPPGGLARGGFLPQFPLIFPELLTPRSGDMAPLNRPERERRPMFSQGWTVDGFGGHR